MPAPRPGTPSVNRLAKVKTTVVRPERGAPGTARGERGHGMEAPVDAPVSQSARTWRSGGDRKIMFENRGGHALTPEAQRPTTLVAILHACAWMLLATGMFQIVISKSGDFRFPLHWVGVLLFFLGLVAVLVRVYTNRCGTKPEWSALIAVGSVAACLLSWLLAEGPLYKDLQTAEECTSTDVWELCGINEVRDAEGNLADPNVCVCRVASRGWDLCIDFTSDCENITRDRRYVLMSIVTLWIGAGLSFAVAVLSMRVVATTHDAGAFVEAEEERRRRMGRAPPFVV